MRARVGVVLSVVLLSLLSTARLRAEELESVTDNERNFTASFSNDWTNLTKHTKLIALQIMKGADRTILVAGGESNLTVEELAGNLAKEDVATGFAAASKQTESTVAGERALTLTGKFSTPQFKGYRCVTLLSHQGISYRIVGITADYDLDFIRDYSTFLSRFKFNADRKEWLDKLAGTPAPIAFLGGLATFNLNTPRWTENTLDLKQENDAVERLSFKYMLGGAWLHVNAIYSDNTPAVEMELLTRKLGQLYKDFKPAGGKEAQVESAPSRQFSGEYGGFKRFLRATVRVADGLALYVWLEGVDSRRTEMESDWEQLMRSLTLRPQSDHTFTPVYMIRKRGEGFHTETTPALEAIVAGATQVLPNDGSETVMSIAPDGNTFLSLGGTQPKIGDLTTHAETPLKATLTARIVVAWSQDSKRLAWTDDAGVHVCPVASGAGEQLLKTHATEVVFAEDQDALLTTVATSARSKTPYAWRYNTTHLEKFVPTSAVPSKHVVEFPFSIVRAVAVSPDKRHFALLTNRDCERTSGATHVYTCDADGTELKQLTHGNEEFSKLAWSTDGKSIYATGIVRAKDAPSPRGYVPADADLFRISAAGGEPVNLSRCAKMRRVWFCGDDVLFDYEQAGADAHRLGIYRISWAELEKATSKFEAPAPPDYKQVAADVTAAILALTGGKDVVLTPELLATAAKTFAATAGPPLHVNFDYSAPSLSALQQFVDSIAEAAPLDRMFILGAGAYYGETLCKVTHAEWKIRPLPFSQWLPGYPRENNALVKSILPFSSLFRHAGGDEDYSSIETEHSLEKRDVDQKWILVYPPSAEKELVDAACDPRYLQSKQLLDRGDVDAATKLLSELMAQHSRNELLAGEVIAICDAAGRPETAKELTHQAVDAGNRVSTLLIRYAEDMLATDPAKAQQLYFQATEADWPSAEVYLKLGRLLDSQKHPELARACWRVAYDRASPKQKVELAALMKGDAPPPASVNADNDADDSDDN